MKRLRSRIVAAAAFVGVFPAIVAAALIAFEFSIPIDGSRGRVAAALSNLLGCPVSIGGSLHLLTGTAPAIEGRDVRLDECRAIRVARASARMVRVRVDLWGLFAREIRLVEIAGERLEAEIPSAAPAPATAGSGAPSRWSFTEITRLHVAPGRLLIRRTGAPPRQLDLASIEGSARAGAPMRLAIRGTQGGEAWEGTLVTASLGDALAGPTRWPVDLALKFASATGSLRGAMTFAPLGLTADFALESAAAERVFAALGAEAPRLGPVSASARVDAAMDRVRLDSLRVAGPVGTLAGEVALTLQGERPVLRANVSAEKLDYAALERWRSAERGGGTVEAIVARELERIRSFDGELTATIGTLVNAPVTATDAHFHASLAAGELAVTNRVTVDGAPGTIALKVDARGPYAFDGRVAVEALPRTAVAQARDVARLDPSIGGLSATLTARGTTVPALLEDLRGQASGQNIRLELPLAGARHDVRLRELTLKGGGGQSIHASARGTFGGEAFELELHGDTVADFFRDEEWSVERLRARIGSARLSATGVAERPRSLKSAKLSVDFAAARLDQLTPLVGAALPSVPGTLKGSIDAGPDAWRVEATTLVVGGTRGKGAAAGQRGRPIEVTLDLDHLAGDDFLRAGDASKPTPARDSAAKLPDLDLRLKARRAHYAGFALQTLTLEGRVRDDAARMPFAFEWAGARIEGAVEARLAQDASRVAANATARGIDVARLPGKLGKSGIAGTIDRVAARIEAGGASPDALAANAAISIDVADARLILPRSGLLPERRVAFGGEVRAPAGGPIDFALEGTLRERPIKVSGRLPPLAALHPAVKTDAVRLAIDYDRTRLEAIGNALLDADAPRFSGTVDLSGETLHTLADLAGFSAPGFGPYRLAAKVEADSGRLAARDLTLLLGKSGFEATITADLTKSPLGIAARVRGEPVHLEDVGTRAWSSARRAKTAAAAESAPRDEREIRAALDRDALALARVLRSFDVDLDVTFEEVSSAGEAIGRAEMRAKLVGGRLTVDPLTMWLDQGKADADVVVDVRGKVPRYDLKFEGTGFDYGPIMRAVDPKSAVSGKLDVSFDLLASGAPEELLRTGSGTFDVLILPKDQQAGKLDVLGAGVLRLVMGTLDPRSDSQLNCVVGSFDIANGLATSRVVLLDTTRARVVGDLDLDLRSQALRGRLAPRSKRPELFTVVPGVQISGTVDSPSVGVSAKEVVTGVLRIWQQPIAFVGDWMASPNMPADGIPDCRAAYRHVLH